MEGLYEPGWKLDEVGVVPPWKLGILTTLELRKLEDKFEFCTGADGAEDFLKKRFKLAIELCLVEGACAMNESDEPTELGETPDWSL